MLLSPRPKASHPRYPSRSLAVAAFRGAAAAGAIAFGLSGCGASQPGGQTGTEQTYSSVPADGGQDVASTQDAGAREASDGGAWREEWVALGGTAVMFDHGSTSLNADARSLLRELATNLEQREDVVRIRLEGHAHSDLPESDPDRVGLERARAVADFLVNEHHLPDELFEVLSHGDSRPRLGGITSQPTAFHRGRVELFMLLRRPVERP